MSYRHGRLLFVIALFGLILYTILGLRLSYHGERGKDIFPRVSSKPSVHLQTLQPKQNRDLLISSIRKVIKLNVCEEFLIQSLNCSYHSKHIPPELSGKDNLSYFKELKQHVVLVIPFNFEMHFHTIPLLYAMYAPQFADIRFCSSLPESKVSTISKDIARYWKDVDIGAFFEPFYVNYRKNMEKEDIWPDHGESSHYCMKVALDSIRAKRPDLEIHGIFQAHDDVLMNYWNFPRLLPDLTRTYIMPRLTVFDIDTLKNCGPDKLNFNKSNFDISKTCSRKRVWFQQSLIYQRSLKDLYAEWEGLQAFTPCWYRLGTVLGSCRRSTAGLIDMMYLSSRNFNTVLPFLGFARKHRVFQEIALPLAVNTCLEPGSFGLIDPGGSTQYYYDSNGGLNRQIIQEVYDAKHLAFGHPFKFSAMIRSTLRNFRDQLNSHEFELCHICMLLRSKFF